MNRFKYARLWLLLAVALAVVSFLSFVEDQKIGGWTVKKAPIAESLLRQKTEKDGMVIDYGVSTNIADADGAGDGKVMSLSQNSISKTMPVDTLPQKIFIFGDSMTFNLALRLAQYARQNGHTIHSVNWDSSNTKIWADHDTLSYYLDKIKPTQIFISLGSNELYFRNPETRAPYVRKILEVIDTLPYVWIGPPNWKEDTGINDMLAKMCRPGAFFRSEGMEFKRKSDHIHPTRQSSADWVDSIMRWLPKSSHPFIAQVPSDSIGKVNPNIVFLKALNK